jgi:hypothetical protein
MAVIESGHCLSAWPLGIDERLDRALVALDRAARTIAQLEAHRDELSLLIQITIDERRRAEARVGELEGRLDVYARVANGGEAIRPPSETAPTHLPSVRVGDLVFGPRERPAKVKSLPSVQRPAGRRLGQAPV